MYLHGKNIGSNSTIRAISKTYIYAHQPRNPKLDLVCLQKPAVLIVPPINPHFSAYPFVKNFFTIGVYLRRTARKVFYCSKDSTFKQPHHGEYHTPYGYIIMSTLATRNASRSQLTTTLKESQVPAKDLKQLQPRGATLVKALNDIGSITTGVIAYRPSPIDSPRETDAAS